MSDVVTVVYKHLVKDLIFRKEFCSIEGNKIPIVCRHSTKGLFCAAYAGWLVGKYGTVEGDRMYQIIKKGGQP